ncbi:MAG TPA: sigma-70 family RNA polymerase sigma factor [Chloroflexota bacterium]
MRVGLSFDDFFQASAREVAAIIALATGDVGLAEDATQEAMARAYARWTRVSKLDRPDRWVVRVAANIAIDTWRRRRREVSLAPTAVSTPPDEVTALWVRWAMERLTPEDRLLLILRHRDDMSMDEIGASLSRSPHTVATYLKRARRRLRAILAEDDS